MESNYDVEFDANYLSECTVQDRAGMYPTIDLLDFYIQQNMQNELMPDENSPIISQLISLGYTYNNIRSYYKQVLGYRNCCLPLSVKYPNLLSITSRIRFMWGLHDITNRDKFTRLIQTITDSSEISPLFNRHRKWQETVENDKSNTATSRKTGTETLARNDSQVHSGQDVTTLNRSDTTVDNTVNGVTSFDQTANFVNDTNSQENATDTTMSTEGTTFGKTITNTGTDTTTHNTSVSDTSSGSDDTDRAGDEWTSDLSLAEAQEREIVLNTILDQYFTSVAHFICLTTLEEIW